MSNHSADPKATNPLVNAYLSTGAEVFKSKIIEEFILIDSGGSTITSAYTVNDLVEDDELYSRVLAETPNQLIRFAPIRRIEKNTKLNLDKRLLRISSKNSFPIGVWANWVVNHIFWQRMITILIIIDAGLLGLQVEIDPEVHYLIIQGARIADQVILVVFVIEIVLKWMDSFWGFWNDGWNVFDVFITVVSAVPELLSVFSAYLSSDVNNVVDKIRVVRVFRFLKTIARFPALRIIVSATFKTMKAMSTIMQLLAIVAFTYAIFVMYLFANYTSSDNPNLFYNERFSNMLITLFTLFQLLTYDHWFVMLQDVEQIISPVVTTFFFLSWVFISAMIFRNLFIGVMVNNFSDISRKAKKRERQKKRKRQMDILRQKIYMSLNNETTSKRKKNRPPNIAEQKAQLAVEKIMKIRAEQEANMDANAPSYHETFVALKAYLANRPDGTFQWDKNMEQIVETIAATKSETLWHRDILFKYFLTMEQLQENMKEYQELMNLAALALCDLHDS